MKPHRAQGHPSPPRGGEGWCGPFAPLSSSTRGGGRGGREGGRSRKPPPVVVWPCGAGSVGWGSARLPPVVWFCVSSLEQEDHTTSLLEEGGGREGPWAVQGMQRAAPDEVIPSPPLERDRGLSALDHKSCQSQQFSSMHFLYFPARKIQRREYIESVIEDHQDHGTVMLNEIGIG